jgi:hypothetical protein
MEIRDRHVAEHLCISRGLFRLYPAPEGEVMTRSWIVCASCRGTWPMAGTASQYAEMQMMSQPCPRCEAYTLNCVPVREVNVFQMDDAILEPADSTPSLAEVWRAVEG